MYCKNEAHSTPPSSPIWIYLQYECITLRFSPEPGHMFSSADNGTVAMLCLLSIYWSMASGSSSHRLTRLIRKTSAFLSSCGVDQCHPVYSILRTTNLHRRSWDMHNLHAWSSLIIAISYLTIFCKFGSNWNVHWIKPMAHRLLDTQQTTS